MIFGCFLKPVNSVGYFNVRSHYRLSYGGIYNFLWILPKIFVEIAQIAIFLVIRTIGSEFRWYLIVSSNQWIVSGILMYVATTDWAMEEYTIFFGFRQRFLLRLHKEQSSLLLKSPVVDLNNISGCFLKLSNSFRYISVHSHYRLSYGGICNFLWVLPKIFV